MVPPIVTEDFARGVFPPYWLFARARLAEPADAERLTGYVTGGISPFGQRRRLPVFADGTLLEHATVFVSGGRRGLQLEVAPGDLVALLEVALVEGLGG